MRLDNTISASQDGYGACNWTAKLKNCGRRRPSLMPNVTPNAWLTVTAHAESSYLDTC